MKKLLTITIIALLLTAIGCQQDNSIVTPANVISSQSDKPSSNPAISSKSDDLKSDVSSSDLLKLLKVSKQVTFDGATGGKVIFSYAFPDGATVDAELTLEKNSYNGTKTFNIIFDAYNKTVDLDPHGTVFNIPAHLTLKYKGLDFDNDVLISGVRWTDATFVYMPTDGTPYQVMNFNKITVNPKAGELYILDARLPHFSRFGFIRLYDAPTAL